MARHVPTSSREYTAAELISEPPPADALIVGSDQVWRDVGKLNFLDFGPRDLRRVAYAVSARWPSLDEGWIQRASKYTAHLDAVSVREIEGIEVCRKLGREDAVHVVDPVLLLEASDYLDIVRHDGEDREFPRPFLLGYFVNVNNTDHIPWESAVGFARDRRLDLRVVPLQGAELVIPEEYLFAPNPSAWMNAFNKADCIVTNSYHGALFAIVMQRPFLVFLQSGNKSVENCRFSSALMPLGLYDRVLSPSEWRDVTPGILNDRMSQPIDWKRVSHEVSRWRSVSAGFLEKALTF